MAQRAKKILQEEGSHRVHGEAWAKRLCRGDQRDAFVARLQETWEHAGRWIGPDDDAECAAALEAGEIKQTPGAPARADARLAHRAARAPRASTIELPEPDDWAGWDPERRRVEAMTCPFCSSARGRARRPVGRPDHHRPAGAARRAGPTPGRSRRLPPGPAARHRRAPACALADAHRHLIGEHSVLEQAERRRGRAPRSTTSAVHLPGSGRSASAGADRGSPTSARTGIDRCAEWPAARCHLHVDHGVLAGSAIAGRVRHCTLAMPCAATVISNVVPPRPATLPLHATCTPMSRHDDALPPPVMKCPLCAGGQRETPAPRARQRRRAGWTVSWLSLPS